MRKMCDKYPVYHVVSNLNDGLLKVKIDVENIIKCRCDIVAYSCQSCLIHSESSWWCRFLFRNHQHNSGYTIRSSFGEVPIIVKSDGNKNHKLFYLAVTNLNELTQRT